MTVFSFGMRQLVWIGFALLGLWGCSDDETQGDGSPGASGVSSDKYLDELTSDEAAQLCAWSVPKEGGPGSYTCEDGDTGTTPTVEECITKLSSNKAHCLVSLVEACMQSIHGDPCRIWVTDACGAYMNCVLQYGGSTTQ